MSISSARADTSTPPPSAPSAASAASAATGASAAAEFNDRYQGVQLRAGFQTGTYGEALPAELSFVSEGAHSFNDRGALLQWHGDVGVVGGYAGTEHPGHYFIGGTGTAGAEIGIRPYIWRNMSPYFGLGANANINGIFLTDVPYSQYNQINSFRGLTGFTGSAALRYSLGYSFLDASHLVQLTGFVQEAFRAPESIQSGQFFTEVGGRADIDVRHNLKFFVEGLHGFGNGERHDSIFGSNTQADHDEASIGFHKMFGHGYWGQIQFMVTEDSNKTVFPASGTTYETHGPITPSIAISGAIPAL